MSAQLMRATLNGQEHTHAHATLWKYCQTVADGDATKAKELFDALRIKEVQFVLAFSLPLFKYDDQSYLRSIQSKLLASHSITAKREVIRAKIAIESLGYKFKIAIIHKEA